MRRAVTLSLLLSAVVLAGAVSAEEGKFVYKHKPFDEAIYRSTAKSTTNQTIMGMKINTEVSTTDVTRRSCEEVGKDGNFKIRTDNKSLQVKAEISMLGTYEFDSKKTERDSGTMLAGALNPVFSAMNGAGWYYTITPRGDVVKAEGFAELFGGDLMTTNPIGGQFVGGGTNEAAVADISQRYITFPDKVLKRGDSWDHDYEINMPGIGKIKGRRNHRYEGDETKDGRKLARFTFTDSSTVEIDLKSDASNAKGTLTSSSSSGEALFDPEAGRMVSISSKTDLSGTLRVSAGGMDLTIDQSQTQEGKVELLDKLPE